MLKSLSVQQQFHDFADFADLSAASLDSTMVDTRVFVMQEVLLFPAMKPDSQKKKEETDSDLKSDEQQL